MEIDGQDGELALAALAIVDLDTDDDLAELKPEELSNYAIHNRIQSGSQTRDAQLSLLASLTSSLRPAVNESVYEDLKTIVLSEQGYDLLDDAN